MQCVFQITASSLRSDAAIDLLMHLVSQVDPFCIQWVFTDVWYLFFYKIMNMAFWTSYQHFQGVKSTTVCPNHELAKTLMPYCLFKDDLVSSLLQTCLEAITRCRAPSSTTAPTVWRTAPKTAQRTRKPTARRTSPRCRSSPPACARTRIQSRSWS